MEQLQKCEENVLILTNVNESIIKRYDSAVKIAETSRSIHENLKEKMSQRDLLDISPQRLAKLYKIITSGKSEDLKSDLVEIEAIASLSMEFMYEEMKKIKQYYAPIF